MIASGTMHIPHRFVKPHKSGSLHHYSGGSRILKRGVQFQFRAAMPMVAHRGSLVPRPSTPPVFDRLQYAKTEGEGLGNFIT